MFSPQVSSKSPSASPRSIHLRRGLIAPPVRPSSAVYRPRREPALAEHLRPSLSTRCIYLGRTCLLRKDIISWAAAQAQTGWRVVDGASQHAWPTSLQRVPSIRAARERVLAHRAPGGGQGRLCPPVRLSGEQGRPVPAQRGIALIFRAQTERSAPRVRYSYGCHASAAAIAVRSWGSERHALTWRVLPNLLGTQLAIALLCSR
jgi:hypothetical protein